MRCRPHDSQTGLHRRLRRGLECGLLQGQSSYDYVTTFFPLWAGIATPEQAQALVKHLPTFEQPGGLVMSPHETGGQWDLPYAWAPDQLIADEGLRKYGFNKEADRVSYEVLSTVAENFR